MGQWLRSHLTYANVISTIALFLVLSGGVVYAANTVGSADVIDNSLKSVDLKDNAAVKSADVVNDTVTGGGLAAVDLRPNSVAQSEIATNGVAGNEVLNGSLGTAEFSSSIPAAKVTNDTAVVTSDNSGVPLHFNTERYDTANLHDNSTTTSNLALTAPVAGVYEVSASIRWEDNPAGERYIELFLNGDTHLAGDVIDDAPSTFTADQSVTATAKMDAGDSVEVLVSQNSGGDLDVQKQDAISPEFSMTWLAPG
jgi:hypothetical protein